MRDRDDIPVETSDGDRGGGGMGDRLVVGLAALALLGGALILAGKGLGGEKGSASASGSPSGGPSASEPAPTAAASPTPAALTVHDRPLPSQEPERPAPFNGWIRLNQDLQVYDNPSTGATRISALANGTLAYAEEPPDQVPGGIYWLQIDVPSPSGFIVAGLGGKLSVQRYQQGQTAYGGSVAGLAAGPQGFVAWGSTSSRANQVSRPLLATSRDGRTWTDVGAATLRGDSWIRAVAYGPAGWLALASVGSTAQTLWLWASTDGRSWRIVGALPVDASDSEPNLIGSGAGYLLTLTGYRSSDSAAKSWHSVDGASWTQGELPAGAAAAPRLVVGTRSGYYSWPDAYNPGPNKEAAYSADGASWVAVEPPPTLGGGRVVALGDGLLAVDSSPVTGAPRVWRGLFTNGGVTWTSQATSLPRTFGFGSLASNGSSAILFGWDRSTVAIQAWSFSGGAWTPVILPAGAFGGTVPVVAAGSPVGFVAVGSQLNLRADNPVFWSGTERGGWAAERSPIIPPIGERTDLRCPPRPSDPAAFASLDVGTAVICFGNSPITFRAFLGTCEGCTGQSSDVYRPAWLADPGQNQLYLSPVKSEDTWWFGARRASNLPDDPAWRSHWVEVTGHFDDPASGQCRWQPDPHSSEVLNSAQATINSCRQQFVVTRIRVVSGL